MSNKYSTDIARDPFRVTAGKANEVENRLARLHETGSSSRLIMHAANEYIVPYPRGLIILFVYRKDLVLRLIVSERIRRVESMT